MDDLISRQAVIEIVENNHAHDITLIDGDAYTKGYRDGIKMKQSDILEDLAELPTVKTKIIQCRDCKHYKYGMCMKICANKSTNGFCDWGERITE